MDETITVLKLTSSQLFSCPDITDWWPVDKACLEDPSDFSDHDFVFALAYHALEHEAALCTNKVAKQQIGYLLDRLLKLDWR